MNEYMAYDTVALARLRDAIATCTRELCNVRSNDPEASPALQAIAKASGLLGGIWVPKLDALIGCGVLSGYVPSTISSHDLAHASMYVLEHERGWRITTDPLSPQPLALTPFDAASLAWELSHDTDRESFSNAELVALSRSLGEISARPDLVDAFLSNMTSATWTQLCNMLGESHLNRTQDASIFGPEGFDPADVDSVFSGLGSILADDRRRHPFSDAVGLTDEMEPYSAALLIRQLQLPADQLAQASYAVITRSFGSELPSSPGNPPIPHAADILMKAMMTTIGAPTMYVAQLVAQPRLLLDSGQDHALVSTFLQAAIDPGLMSEPTASAVLSNLIPFVLANVDASPLWIDDKDALSTLALSVLIPWLRQCTYSQDSTWTIAPEVGAGWLVQLVQSEQALELLVADRDAIITRVFPTDPNLADDELRIATEQLADVLGLVDKVIQQASIGAAEKAQALWDFAWTVLGCATAFVNTATLGGALALNALLPGIQAAAQEAGVGTTDVDQVRHDLVWQMDFRRAVTAAALVTNRYVLMIEQHQLPEGAPPPPIPNPQSPNPAAQFGADFSKWLSDPAVVGLHGEFFSAATTLNMLKQTISSNDNSSSDIVELAKD